MKLSGLKSVYEHAGPFATVRLDASRDSETGAQEVDGRWRALREQLAAAGAGEPLLAAVEEVALAPTGVAGPCTRLIVAADDRVLLTEVLPGAPPREDASWQPEPDLLPLLIQRADLLPYAVVRLDRVGADITVFGPHGQVAEQETVEGQHAQITKVRAGGWSELRYQHNVENNWERNAGQVARALDELVRDHPVALVAVTGDERAATLLEEHVGTHARELLRRLDAGGRGAGSSDEALESEVAELVRSTAAARDAEVLETFEQNRGRHEAAVEGMAPVVDALRRAQVETLLISDAAPDEEHTLYTAPEPLVLGTTPEEVRALGSEPVRVPASAALLRAAVDSDADVLVVRQTAVDLREGVGATLRYADASTPTT